MIKFHSRPCLLKLNENVLKIFNFSHLLGSKYHQVLFCQKKKRNFFRAQTSTLYIIYQCIKTFQMNNQQSLCALLPPDPSPLPGPDPSKFNYLSALWVAPYTSSKSDKGKYFKSRQLMHNDFCWRENWK